MSVICSRCGNVFRSASSCPRCGAPAPDRDASGLPGHGPRWLHNPIGRILIGLILAQGLFYGLRHLATAIVLATSEAAAGASMSDLWHDPTCQPLLQGIQLFTVFIGSILAGGGQRGGFVLGAVVGAWNGALAISFKQNPGVELALGGPYGQAALHALCGLIGGAVGATIWKPIPIATVPFGMAPTPKKVVKRKQGPSPFAGPVAWGRVFLGAVLAVAGTLSANWLFEKGADLFHLNLNRTNPHLDDLVVWEIKAVAILLGGTLAGFGTSNGIKQGLFVGLLGTSMLVGIQAPRTPHWLGLVFFTLVSTLCLALVGGWFGGQLFPPIIKPNHRGIEAVQV